MQDNPAIVAHIPRRFFRAVRQANFEEASEYLGIMIASEAGRYPGRDDILTVFVASHLASALDLAGFLDMRVMVPIEPVVEQALQRWHREYPTAEDWARRLALGTIETVCALNGLIPGLDTENAPVLLPGYEAWPERIRMVCAYVAGHFQEPDCTVSTVAEHFDVHVSWLSRVFSEATGLRLSDYIRQYRFRHAKVLLALSPLPISEIAAACGFSSSNTFIRAFRAAEGVTPGTFRAALPPEGTDRPGEAAGQS